MGAAAIPWHLAPATFDTVVKSNNFLRNHSRCWNCSSFGFRGLEHHVRGCVLHHLPPREDLVPVLPAPVEQHLVVCARPPTEAPAQPCAQGVRPADCALGEPGAANVRVEHHLPILVNQDLEFLDAALVQCHATLVDPCRAWHGAHGAEVPAAALGDEVVVVPVLRLGAAPGPRARGRCRAHGQAPLGDLQPKRHRASRRTADQPSLARAFVVRAPDGDLSLHCPGGGWVYHLRPVPITHQVELLLARGTDAHRCLVSAGLSADTLHLAARPRRPRACDAVCMLVHPPVGQGWTPSGIRELLPRDPPELSCVQGVGPREGDAVNRPRDTPVHAAINEPTPALPFPIRPLDVRLLVRFVNDRIESLACFAVDHDAEPLTLYIPKDNGGCPLPRSLALHLHHLRPRIPSAHDVQPIGWPRARQAIVFDAGMKHVGELQLVDRMDCVCGCVAIHAARPDVAAGICASDAEG
mmetsp:Transcript_80953/g.262205  ORF Transcript_80953/g.262205 Transcript_80953/m.262205 type:complete len:468 (-) Transcript_80953:2384-3787(-)